MKFVVCLVLFLFLSNSFSQNVSPQFSELKGMEDQSANTHLFYRIQEENYDSSGFGTKYNHIYHFYLAQNSDSLFLRDSLSFFSGIQSYHKIHDLDFWNNNPAKYINCGGFGWSMESNTFIKRFDSGNNYFKDGVAFKIQISFQDDSLLYAGVSVYDTSGLTVTVKSTDGGWNWEKVLGRNQIVSLSPFDDQIFFAENVMDYKLNKTTDGGNTFYVVDTSTYFEEHYQYDLDGNHIYRTTSDPLREHYELIVSDNQGEPFTWAKKYVSNTKIFTSNNRSVTGELYLADEKNIYVSTDYGNSFNLYKRLDRNIVGIYKKSNSDKLYAATKYKIYEITPDSIQVIKSLPIPDEVLNYYPLAVGNKWVYDKYTHIEWNTYHDIFIRTVVGDSLLPNGKKYFHLFEDIVGFYSQTYFERIDSSEGKVYRYDDSQGFPDDEFVIDDLLAELGDTILSYRMGYWEEGYTTMIDQVTFEKWGLTKPKKVFEQYILHPPVYSLTQDIGLDSIFSFFDFGETRVILKGCIIDGTVYGDTTLVSVEDETPNLPIEFSLSQNYPNPFNPATTIRFTIPQDERRETRNVSLKVYDVLGNEIAILVNEEKPAGNYKVVFYAANLPSGIYFYKLRAGSYSAAKKMILMK